MLKYKFYKWLTRNNSYLYVDILESFVSGYSDAVDSSMET